jgi:hypothetical protein
MGTKYSRSARGARKSSDLVLSHHVINSLVIVGVFSIADDIYLLAIIKPLFYYYKFVAWTAENLKNSASFVR